MSKIKYKKQFRLYDIYRYIVTKEMSHIEGIDQYEVNNDASVIKVEYGFLVITYIAHNEDELKDVVREINKHLGNCSKPGKKPYRK